MTKAELTYHDVQITTAWPTRGCVAPFGTESPCDPVYRQPAAFRLWYEPILAIGELRIVAQGWTFFECKYRFPFNGTSDALATWLRTKAGVRRAYQDAQAYQNSVIDRMKAAYPFNTDIANLRHFGPADWPFITVVAGGMPVLTIANPALRAELTTVPLEIRETLMQEDPPSSVLAGLLRAYDLLQCGYPTESVVVAFSLLDAFLQEELTSRMEAKGLSQQAAEEILVNTTVKRVSTYVDPLLHLVVGASLREDRQALFEDLIRVNRLRNDAVHRGRDISRTKAEESLLVIYSSLQYLDCVLTCNLSLPAWPTH